MLPRDIACAVGRHHLVVSANGREAFAKKGRAKAARSAFIALGMAAPGLPSRALFRMRAVQYIGQEESRELEDRSMKPELNGSRQYIRRKFQANRCLRTFEVALGVGSNKARRGGRPCCTEGRGKSFEAPL